MSDNGAKNTSLSPRQHTGHVIHVSLPDAVSTPNNFIDVETDMPIMGSVAGAPMPKKARRRRLSRNDEKIVLNAYSSGMPELEILSKFSISKTQLSRILSDAFQTKQIQPVSARYYLLQNGKQYSALFAFLGCPTAQFLKCENNGKSLIITPHNLGCTDHE